MVVTEEFAVVTRVLQVLVVTVVVVVVLVPVRGKWDVCSCAIMPLRANKKDFIFALSFIHKNSRIVLAGRSHSVRPLSQWREISVSFNFLLLTLVKVF